MKILSFFKQIYGRRIPTVVVAEQLLEAELDLLNAQARHEEWQSACVMYASRVARLKGALKNAQIGD